MGTVTACTGWARTLSTNARRPALPRCLAARARDGRARGFCPRLPFLWLVGAVWSAHDFPGLCLSL